MKLIPKSFLSRTILMILIPLVIALVIVANAFFGNHWARVHSYMARSLSGEIATMLNLIHNNQDEAVKIMSRDTAVNVSINSVLNRPKRNDNKSHEVGDLHKYLRKQINIVPSIYIDKKKKLIFVDIPQSDGKIITFATALNRIYSTSTDAFIVWLLGSLVLVSLLITPFIILHSRSISKIAKAANRFGRGLDFPKFTPSGSREIRTAATALISMKERLDRYNRTRTDMLNAVSHDLKSPLTRIKLAVETDSIDKKTLLTDIDRMTEMINGYLAFARGETPEIEQEVSLPSMLTRIARDEAKKLDLELNFPENSKMFYARPLSLARAFTNLIENAARYAKTKIVITEHDTDEAIEVLIDDDGIGIPANKRSEVMQPFVRLDSSRSEKTGGTGLGLSIAQTAIENHGGEIYLMDSPLGGLRVRVILPI